MSKPTKTPITDRSLQKAWDFEREWVSPTTARQIEEAASDLAEALAWVKKLPHPVYKDAIKASDEALAKWEQLKGASRE